MLSSGPVAIEPMSLQTLAVWLAFIAAALSFAAVAIGYSGTGVIQTTPLVGGLLMLALGVGGYVKLKNDRS
jgi:hypothetical protein